ncbi:MAG: hypothetical protein AMXMBFR58_20580 [Phycisphaerae bacterium]|nr:Protein IscX [Phycisphaerales bacterium]
MNDSFGWLDVDEIGERLFLAFPDRDPFSVRFTELRRLVESLPGFEPDPDHPVNEKILETIQARWHEAREDLADPDED